MLMPAKRWSLRPISPSGAQDSFNLRDGLKTAPWAVSCRGERGDDDLAIRRVAIVLAGHFSHTRHLHRGDVGLLVPAGECPGQRIAVGALQSHVRRAAEGGAKVSSRHSLAHVVGHERRGAELEQHVDGAVVVFGLRQAGACSVLGPLVTARDGRGARGNNKLGFQVGSKRSDCDEGKSEKYSRPKAGVVGAPNGLLNVRPIFNHFILANLVNGSLAKRLSGAVLRVPRGCVILGPQPVNCKVVRPVRLEVRGRATRVSLPFAKSRGPRICHYVVKGRSGHVAPFALSRSTSTALVVTLDYLDGRAKR